MTQGRGAERMHQQTVARSSHAGSPADGPLVTGPSVRTSTPVLVTVLTLMTLVTPVTLVTLVTP
jgi:hypothetical protein